MSDESDRFSLTAEQYLGEVTWQTTQRYNWQMFVRSMTTG